MPTLAELNRQRGKRTENAYALWTDYGEFLWNKARLKLHKNGLKRLVDVNSSIEPLFVALSVLADWLTGLNGISHFLRFAARKNP